MPGCTWTISDELLGEYTDYQRNNCDPIDFCLDENNVDNFKFYHDITFEIIHTADNECISSDLTIFTADNDIVDSITYPVKIDKNEENPETIIIEDLRTSDESFITGYYDKTFIYFVNDGDTIKYLTNEQELVTVREFSDINVKNLNEMISVHISSEPIKTFTYIAYMAWNISTGILVTNIKKEYKIDVYNHWDKGLKRVVEFVGITTE